MLKKEKEKHETLCGGVKKNGGDGEKEGNQIGRRGRRVWGKCWQG